ncbi:hypothetical protein MEME101129_20380 [Methylobacterium mesophilicum]
MIDRITTTAYLSARQSNLFSPLGGLSFAGGIRR